jgi:hypothetical protein
MVVLKYIGHEITLLLMTRVHNMIKDGNLKKLVDKR